MNACHHLPAIEPETSQVWRDWIAESKISGYEDEDLITAMVQSGFTKPIATKEVADVNSNPLLRAAISIAQAKGRLESLLDSYNELAGVSARSRFHTIERRSNVSREEFAEQYYSVNRPLVMLNLMHNWKARTIWTPEYFRDRFGQELVEVMADRNSDPQYEINSFSHKRTMRFGAYIDRITQPGETNDVYLVANNSLLTREAMKPLMEDFSCFPEYLDPSSAHGSSFLWLGAAGTVTPLHYDVMNILMCQVRGRKRVTLIPSYQAPLVYNEIGVFSQVDCENPDYERFPLFRGVRIFRLILQPGEVLFIPIGWWHHVRSLDVSMTLTFSNFVFPNRYNWSKETTGY